MTTPLPVFPSALCAVAASPPFPLYAPCYAAGGGSGFGLFICKGIVDLHKGKIDVWSEGEGHGSTFTVQLPMRRAPVQAAGNVSASARLARAVSVRMLRMDSGAHASAMRLRDSQRSMSAASPSLRPLIASEEIRAPALVNQIEQPVAAAAVVATAAAASTGMPGAVAALSLPSQLGPEGASAGAGPKEAKKGASHSTAYRVLLVDDSPLNRKMYVPILSLPHVSRRPPIFST